MLKTLLFFLLIPAIAFAQKPVILSQDYSFLIADIEVRTLRQVNDMLYELKCYTDKPCLDLPARNYKILDQEKTGNFKILKLEQLGSEFSGPAPPPSTRFQVHVFKINNDKQIGYLKLKAGLSRQELDNYQVNGPALNDMFFFTYFSASYLKELSALKKITTKADADSILENFSSENFKPLIDSYKKNQVPDMYGSGLIGELLSRSCIEKGFDPFGAGQSITTLNKR